MTPNTLLEIIIKAAKEAKTVFFNSSSGWDESFIDADLFIAELEKFEKQNQNTDKPNFERIHELYHMLIRSKKHLETE